MLREITDKQKTKLFQGGLTLTAPGKSLKGKNSLCSRWFRPKLTHVNINLIITFIRLRADMKDITLDLMSFQWLSTPGLHATVHVH